MSYAPLDDTSNSVKHVVSADEHDEESHSAAPRSSPVIISQTLKEPLTSTSADPYYEFRDDLYQKLDRMDESLVEYLRVVQQTDSAVHSTQLKEAKRTLKRSIKVAESTWKDVNMAVTMVQSNPEKFHYTEKELYERNAVVHTSQARIAECKTEMNSESVKAKLLDDEKAKMARRNFHNANGNPSHVAVESAAKQSLLLQHQDETLDELGHAVVNVTEMAHTIQDEIGQQNKMLEELETDLDNIEEELGMVLGKLGKFLQTKNRWQLGTILCMTGAVVVLFLLVLYT